MKIKDNKSLMKRLAESDISALEEIYVVFAPKVRSFVTHYIGKEEAERLLGFCNNSGPAFIVGAVGAGIFGSPSVGLALYGIHILSESGSPAIKSVQL